MPRFAVLTHDHPFPHWDFLLEAGEVCRTWRLLAEPASGRTVPAEPIADHRTHYLTYEGPVGGDRGTVARWDAGAFAWVEESANRTEVELKGARLRGRCVVNVRDGSATFGPMIPDHGSHPTTGGDDGTAGRLAGIRHWRPSSEFR